MRCPNEKCYAEFEVYDNRTPAERAKNMDDEWPHSFLIVSIVPEHWHERSDPIGPGSGQAIYTGDRLNQTLVAHIQRRCKLSGSKIWIRYPASK